MDFNIFFVEFSNKFYHSTVYQKTSHDVTQLAKDWSTLPNEMENAKEEVQAIARHGHMRFGVIHKLHLFLDKGGGHDLT